MSHKTRYGFVVVAALMSKACGGCGDASLPTCPIDTVLVDGACRRGCAADGECLASERCDPTIGACIPKDVGPPPNAPTILSFTVDPPVITAPNQQVTIHYEVKDATSVSIDPGVLNHAPDLTKTLDVTVQDTTTFTLTAFGVGNVTEQRTVALEGGGVAIVAFTASPDHIAPGGQVMLSWDVRNASAGSIRITQPLEGRLVGDALGAQGSLTDAPATLPAEYWIEAQGESDRVRAFVRVFRVVDGDPRIVRFDRAPDTIAVRDTVLLVWQTENASSLALDDGPSRFYETSDPYEVGLGFRLVAPEMMTTYTITAFNDVGAMATATSKIDIGTPSPPIINLVEAQPAVRTPTNPGATIEARWDVSNSTKVTLQVNDTLTTDVVAAGRQSFPAAAQNFVFELVAENKGAVAASRFGSWFVVSEEEPNDDLSQADDVVSTARAGAITLQLADVDSFKLDVPDGGAILARLAGRESPEQCPDVIRSITATLLDPQGAQIAHGMLDAQGCQMFDRRHLAAGTYFIQLSSTNAPAVEFLSYGLFADVRGPECGDRVAEGGEGCDDGNRMAGDGCDGYCKVEAPPDYTVQPRMGAVLGNGPPVVLPLDFRPALAGGDPLDDGVAIVPFPFTFEFYGHRYAGAVVSTNGFVSLRPEAETQPSSPQAIPSDVAPNALIAPFYADLELARFSDATGEVVTFTRDAGNGNRQFEIRFRNLTGVNDEEESHTLFNAAVILEENTNIVRIHYGSMIVPAGGATVTFFAGIEDDKGGSGRRVPACDPACDNGSELTDVSVTFTPVAR